jgi:uncharacterized membrane protein
MYNELCHSGNLGSLGNFDVWGGIGLILNLVFWVALLAGLTLLVVLAIRRARVPAAAVSQVSGQPTDGGHNTTKESLQAQYARGEITREQYELRKQEIG